MTNAPARAGSASGGDPPSDGVSTGRTAASRPHGGSGTIRPNIDAVAMRTHMHIDLNEAIRIHARVGRARYGRAAKKRALDTAQSRSEEHTSELQSRFGIS